MGKKPFIGIHLRILICFIVLFPSAFVFTELFRLYGIPFTGYTGYIRQEKEDAISSLNQVADLKKIIIDNWLTEIHRDISVFIKGSTSMHLDDIQENSSHAISFHLKQITSKFIYVKRMDIVDYNTKKVVFSSDSSEINSSNPVYEIPAGLKNHQVLNFAPVTWDTEKKCPVLKIYAILDPPEDEHPHLLVVHINLNYLQEIANQSQTSNYRNSIYLVDENLQVLSSPGYTHDPSKIPALDRLTTRAARMSILGQEGSLESKENREKVLITAFRHIRLTSGKGWGLLVEVDKEDVYRPIVKSTLALLLRNMLIWLILLIVLFMIVFELTRPLLKLSQAADQMEQLNFEVNIPVKRNDEIGRVTNTFNRMARKISGWQEELEQTISDRTAELTEKKAMLEAALVEKKLLFRELNHRVKNNLNLVKSLLSLQSDYITDEKAKKYLKNCRERINTILLVHKQLYQKDRLTSLNTIDYIRELYDGLINSYNPEIPITLKLSVDENIIINMDTLIPLALIITEIISNSLKYAFTGHKEGTITILLNRTNEQTKKPENNKNTYYSLVIGDDGQGSPDYTLENKRKTMGLLLIKSFVTQLKGTVSISQEAGYWFYIHFAQP